jgi:hypothetical protein
MQNQIKSKQQQVVRVGVNEEIEIDLERACVTYKAVHLSYQTTIGAEVDTVNFVVVTGECLPLSDSHLLTERSKTILFSSHLNFIFFIMFAPKQKDIMWYIYVRCGGHMVQSNE